MKKFACCVAAVFTLAAVSFAADAPKPAAGQATTASASTDKSAAAKPATATVTAKSEAATAAAEASCCCDGDSCSPTRKVFLSPRAKESLHKPLFAGS